MHVLMVVNGKKASFFQFLKPIIFNYSVKIMLHISGIYLFILSTSNLTCTAEDLSKCSVEFKVIWMRNNVSLNGCLPL